MEQKLLLKSKVLITSLFVIASIQSGIVSAQHFNKYQENPFSLSYPRSNTSPAFVDLDGDGDLDMMTGSYQNGFAYFKNIGTAISPLFAAYIENPFSLSYPRSYTSPTFADLDGDGDFDMMTGSYQNGFAYFKNIGNANSPLFAAYVENPFSLSYPRSYTSPAFADLDGDGDLDMMTGSYQNGFGYFQNNGTVNSPKFAAFVENPFSLSYPRSYTSPSFADLDGDGDMDMMTGSYQNGFAYFQNNGTANVPKFAAFEENPFSLSYPRSYTSPAIADLDGDSDLDMMTGSYQNGFAFFENSSFTGIFEISKDRLPLKIYPNPAKGSIQIEINCAAATLNNYNLSIRNVIGETVFYSANFKDHSTIDISSSPSGIYFVEMCNGTEIYKSKIVKQ